MAWGVGIALADYIDAANAGVACIVQIETRQALEIVDEIAAVPGIDCLFVGLSDMSVDLGVPGEFRHPDVVAALDRVIAAARARGISVGVPISDFTLAAGYLERGVTLFATTDRGIVATGMANFLRSI
jgi:2-dehydro-3-deoxyglucarate aldolase